MITKDVFSVFWEFKHTHMAVTQFCLGVQISLEKFEAMFSPENFGFSEMQSGPVLHGY